MGTAIRVEMLPARLGDCLLVECLREDGPPWRMLVDGGPPDTWPVLEARLKPDPRLDVVVVTHIDSDHIGGIIPYLRSGLAREAGDVWFNGPPQLRDVVIRSEEQGEAVAAALLGEDGRSPLPWNVAFGGKAIVTGEKSGFSEPSVPEDWPRITVLSPTAKRLRALGRVWLDVVREQQRGDQRLEEPDDPPPLGDLEPLAREAITKDDSIPNGSSIALLIEHRGVRLLLGADAFGDVLGTAMHDLAAARGVDTVDLDAFKLPHHGSRKNVLEALLPLTPARHHLFSTDGGIFRHPDDVAIARVVLDSPAHPTLWFDYDTPRTRRWADPSLRERYGYDVRYPDTSHGGIVLELPARS